MTRLEALPVLAEGAMGWTLHTPYNEQYPCFYLPGLSDLPDEFSVQMDSKADIQPWNPWTDRCQALDLAEAWRAKGNTRWWRLFSPQARTACKTFTVHLNASIRDLARGCCYSNSDTIAAALTGAACKAMEIEVEEA
jgi:hypothetical protein